jgi:hypothetical protein
MLVRKHRVWCRHMSGVLPHPWHEPEDERDEQDEERPEVNGRLSVPLEAPEAFARSAMDRWADRSREVRGAHDVRDRDTPVRVTDATACARPTRALSNEWFAGWSWRSFSAMDGAPVIAMNRECAARVKAAPAPSAARGALDTRKRSRKMTTRSASELKRQFGVDRPRRDEMRSRERREEVV